MRTKIKRKLTGVVVSTSMVGTAVVKITREIPHPKYGKLMKRSKKLFVAYDEPVTVGDVVSIVEDKKMAKNKSHRIVSK